MKKAKFSPAMRVEVIRRQRELKQLGKVVAFATLFTLFVVTVVINVISENQ